VKIGAENRKQVMWASGLGLLALVLMARWLFFTSGPTPIPAAPPAASTPASPRPAGGKKAVLAPSLDPTLRLEWLKQSEDAKYEGRGQNIFVSRVDIPAPIAPGNTDHAKVTPPTPPVAVTPPPPPINLKFYGFATSHGEPKKVFLSEGEDIFIASEGDIIDRRYKILHVSPMSVEVEDVLNNNRQQIPLTQS